MKVRTGYERSWVGVSSLAADRRRPRARWEQRGTLGRGVSTFVAYVRTDEQKHALPFAVDRGDEVAVVITNHAHRGFPQFVRQGIALAQRQAGAKVGGGLIGESFDAYDRRCGHETAFAFALPLDEVTVDHVNLAVQCF